MTPEVKAAVEEIREAFPAASVTALEDGGGGAHVTVDPVKLSDVYTQDQTWVRFHITFQYPYADVYPHFIRPDLTRKDGKPLGDGMSVIDLPNNQGRAVQISRRSNKLNPESDTALVKLLKVLHWVRNHP